MSTPDIDRQWSLPVITYISEHRQFADVFTCKVCVMADVRHIYDSRYDPACQRAP